MSEKEVIKTGIIKAVKERGFGFIAGEDGKDIYFHATNLVVPEFQQLKKGDKVNYVERQGKKSMEAAEVVVI